MGAIEVRVAGITMRAVAEIAVKQRKRVGVVPAQCERKIPGDDPVKSHGNGYSPGEIHHAEMVLVKDVASSLHHERIAAIVESRDVGVPKHAAGAHAEQSPSLRDCGLAAADAGTATAAARPGYNQAVLSSAEGDTTSGEGAVVGQCCNGVTADGYEGVGCARESEGIVWRK